uniref:Uncharacterized protein n=1 Tax=Musa acuminata subsp. malaccensis TaxID=214687 RepID=A0A804KAE8_MUSAM
MVVLRALRGGKTLSAPSTRSPAEARASSREAPVDVEAGRPRKQGLPQQKPLGKLRLSQRGQSPHRPATAGRALGEEQPAPVGRRRGRLLESPPSANFAAFRPGGRMSPTKRGRWVTSRRASPPTH